MIPISKYHKIKDLVLKQKKKNNFQTKTTNSLHKEITFKKEDIKKKLQVKSS